MSRAPLVPWWLGYSAEPYPVDMFASQLFPALDVDVSHIFISAETPPAFHPPSEMISPRV